MTRIEAGAEVANPVVGTLNAKAWVLDAFAVSRIADLAFEAWCGARVANANPIAAAHLPAFASASARRCFADTQATALSIWAVYVGTTGNTGAVQAVLIVAWAYDTSTCIGDTLVNHAKLIVATKLGETTAIIELAGAIAWATRGTRAATGNGANFDTVSGDAGCCIAFSVGRAIDVEARVDQAEIIGTAQEALWAGELACLAGECTLAIRAA